MAETLTVLEFDGAKADVTILSWLLKGPLIGPIS